MLVLEEMRCSGVKMYFFRVTQKSKSNLFCLAYKHHLASKCTIKIGSNVNNQTLGGPFCLLSTLKSARNYRPENEWMYPKKEPFQEENHLPTSNQHFSGDMVVFRGSTVKRMGPPNENHMEVCNPIQGLLVFSHPRLTGFLVLKLQNGHGRKVVWKGSFKVIYIYIYLMY